MTFKKQVILSITGLSIMIVLLVGVSYSFVVPSNTGDTIEQVNFVSNVEKGSNLVLNNKRPISYEEVSNEEFGNEDNNSLIIRFNINAYNSIKDGVNFKVALLIDPTSDKSLLLDDSVIHARITAPKPIAGYSVTDYGVNENMTYGSSTEGAPLTGINSGKEITLLKGNVHTQAMDAVQQFEIRIWLDSSKVMISDSVNRDNNGRALDYEENGYIAANKEDVGKLVYRTSEIQEKISTFKVVVQDY